MADYASEYGIRLHAKLDAMTWVEFRDLLQGIFAAETRLWRHFTRDQEPSGPEPPQ